MTNSDRILNLCALGAYSHQEMARELKLPEPSVRRTALHLMAAGKLVFAGTENNHQTWRVPKEHDKPNVYLGVQDIDKKVYHRA